ncbi:S1 family peptidase [Vibrio scophthalmi]|uniref:S1 family peptidase n=1 Tax=Vibrio scophthalmi TaxID=45658 RepID=UPI003EB86F24
MSKSIQDLYKQYSGSLAYVEVESTTGDLGIGSAFHVGEGVFVTAKHVIENKNILEVATTKQVEVFDSNGKQTKIDPRVMPIIDGPHFSTESDVDVAVFKVSGYDPLMPVVPLGHHLDDSIDDHDFVLSQVLVMGYPPVPSTNDPCLVTVRAEVNSIINVRHSDYLHFIVSATARGGFSGGLVISEGEFALGIVTESLVENHSSAETGFMSVLSIESIFACISHHYSIPLNVALSYEHSEDLVAVKLTKPSLVRLNPRIYCANIYVYDDDRDVFIELECSDSNDLAAAYAAFNSITPIQVQTGQSRPGYIFAIPTTNPPSSQLIGAAEAAKQVLTTAGYIEK